MSTRNRQQIVSDAQRAHPARQPSGGTTAPRGTAGGPRTGVGAGRPAPPPRRTAVGPGRPLPAAGASGAGAAPGGRAPTPWDSRAEQKISGARKSYLDATGSTTLDEETLKQEFGLDGPYADVTSNPNSRAALLEETFKQHNAGTMNTAGYNLYSGSTGNRLNANRVGYGRDRDQLEQLYRDELQKLNDRRLEAAERKQGEEGEADWERVQHAEEEPLDPTQAPQPKKSRRKTRRDTTSAAIAKAKQAAPPKRRK